MSKWKQRMSPAEANRIAAYKQTQLYKVRDELHNLRKANAQLKADKRELLIKQTQAQRTANQYKDALKEIVYAIPTPIGEPEYEQFAHQLKNIARDVLGLDN